MLQKCPFKEGIHLYTTLQHMRKASNDIGLKPFRRSGRETLKSFYKHIAPLERKSNLSINTQVHSCGVGFRRF
jgi:hypothetical protein